jgi:hypothetical protein
MHQAGGMVMQRGEHLGHGGGEGGADLRLGRRAEAGRPPPVEEGGGSGGGHFRSTPLRQTSGRRNLAEHGERIGGGIEQRLRGMVLQGGGEQVVAEILEQQQASGGVGGQHARHGEAGFGQRGADGEKGPGVLMLGRGVHQHPGVGAAEAPVAAEAGILRERGDGGAGAAMRVEEGADLVGAAHAQPCACIKRR